MILSKHFKKYYWIYAPLLIVGLLVLFVVDYVQLEIPANIGRIITHYEFMFELPSYPSNAIIAELKWILIWMSIATVGRFLWRYLIFGTSRKIEQDIRNQMFLHATKLSSEFYSKEKVGGLMAYFINDVQAVRLAFGPGLLTLSDGIFLGGFALYRMFQVDVMMTVYAFIPLVAIAVMMYFLRSSMQAKFKRRQKSFEDMSDLVQESFSGLSVVKAYVKEAIEAVRFKKRTEDYYNTNLDFVKKHMTFHVSINISISVVILTIIGYGAHLIINGSMNAGTLVTYISYFSTLIWPMMAFTRFLAINSQAQASAKRLEEFLDYPIDINDDQAVPTEIIGSGIRVDNLTFAYPDDPETPVLSNISFEIKAGQRVGILGRTGSGKSTLVEILLRLYNIKNDTVFLDGHDIMTVPLDTVRDAIGYVPQDNFLFSDTIKNNIGFSYQVVGDEVVEQSAKLADVYTNVIEFKEGFNTILGERGVTVSGGQKQRISIARALAKDPKILILDDSVSAVDTKTEEAIINNLDRVRKGKTTIFIAHRISTVRHMDKIVLLDKGKLVGVGTHEELKETSQLYQELVRLQTLENLEAEGGVDNERL
ncbi:MAG: ABC transporter ATP-binding protein [Acholeplasmataceae bacterium]|jgi:ATP-binding cassette subfamily B protein|nr:ABC transporter ATP-binding protein [Acholeplasmataceae bacterium]